MRKIAIVGAGQAGLQLALALTGQGYQVVVQSNATAEQIRSGRVTSSQCMFAGALGLERELGLAFWGDKAPDIDGISFTLAAPEGQVAFDWAHRLDAPAQSVDQRVKLPRWMEEFVARGGELRIGEADIETLEGLARECELVLVAAGKGEINRLFERDAERSPYDAPMRALALTYLHGMRPRADYPAVSFNLFPGVGEYFCFPALTLSGRCDILVFEGVPGGPMDCWDPAAGADRHLDTTRAILKRFAPWELERCADVRVTDPGGVLAGRFTPAVRKPVATLPSGARVLGLGDTVCLNDPITGQGSNNAAKAAAVYTAEILAREDRAFDAAWMQATFDAYWAYARHVTAWTNAMLAPPLEHVQQLLAEAGRTPAIARWLVNGFDHPPAIAPAFLDPAAAARRIADAV